jgi:DNA polymerase-3 subunit epsilon
MREICLDTETTGFDPATGHRVVEIGCVELYGRIRTGNTFHAYLNPERDVPEDAFRVHGISTEFLQDKPFFANIADRFLAFIGESPLVIHNAGFDMKFVNAELGQAGFDPLPMDRAIDTVIIARKKYPGAPASLDALCKRFNIDLSSRTKHGALLDAELLAEVYLELMGGRQESMKLLAEAQAFAASNNAQILTPREHTPTPEEIAAHEAFLKKIKNPMWLEEVAESA